MTLSTAPTVRLYDGESDSLVSADLAPERVTLLPGEGGAPGHGTLTTKEHIRIMWGQDMLSDVLDGRYRSIVVGVNDVDNSHGIIARLVELIRTSQWTPRTVTSYARMFHESVAVHAAHDREPYVLKFDLDRLLIFGVLRPKGHDCLTLDDLGRGFETVTKMLSDRHDRKPTAAVSFLSASANRLKGPDGREPSFEAVLRTMFNAGFRGDVYPAPPMWKLGNVGVFPSYPFPAGVTRMREGSS